jgi:hypothetical protein
MVWEDQPAVGTIVMIVVHLPVFSGVLLKIGMVRKDLCHFYSSLCGVPGWLFISPFVGRVCVQTGVGANYGSPIAYRCNVT